MLERPVPFRDYKALSLSCKRNAILRREIDAQTDSMGGGRKGGQEQTRTQLLQMSGKRNRCILVITRPEGFGGNVQNRTGMIYGKVRIPMVNPGRARPFARKVASEGIESALN